MGMATLSHGAAAWFYDGSIDLGEHIVRAFEEAHSLASTSIAIAQGKPHLLIGDPPRRQIIGHQPPLVSALQHTAPR